MDLPLLVWPEGQGLAKPLVAELAPALLLEQALAAPPAQSTEEHPLPSQQSGGGPQGNH